MTKPKKKKTNGDTGPQRREVSLNKCAVCFGLYDEDIDSETADLMSDWIQCTNDGCGVWVHTECLDKCDGDYVCCVCGTLLLSLLPSFIIISFLNIKAT